MPVITNVPVFCLMNVPLPDNTWSYVASLAWSTITVAALSISPPKLSASPINVPSATVQSVAPVPVRRHVPVPSLLKASKFWNTVPMRLASKLSSPAPASTKLSALAAFASNTPREGDICSGVDGENVIAFEQIDRAAARERAGEQ